MINADEIGEDGGQVRFSVTVLETTQLQSKTQVRTDKLVHSLAPYELNLPGSQLLVGFISALSALALLLWVS
jgi:hypothetical protein